jgi:hypothetical protein
MERLATDPQDGSAAVAALPSPLTCAAVVSAEIARLSSLDLDELRVRWRRLFRKPAPPHLPRYLILRIIAYRIQANAFGDLDRETIRFLDQIAKQRRSGNRSKAIVRPVAQKRGLKPGTLLVREHDGELHRVMVMENGFAWKGGIYKSLSEVARAITGTNWNGPRFFGLRVTAKPADPDAETRA